MRVRIVRIGERRAERVGLLQEYGLVRQGVRGEQTAEVPDDGLEEGHLRRLVDWVSTPVERLVGGRGGKEK